MPLQQELEDQLGEGDLNHQYPLDQVYSSWQAVQKRSQRSIDQSIVQTESIKDEMITIILKQRRSNSSTH